MLSYGRWAGHGECYSIVGFPFIDSSRRMLRSIVLLKTKVGLGSDVLLLPIDLHEGLKYIALFVFPSAGDKALTPWDEIHL